MTYPVDPVSSPQVVVRDGQIFYRAFSEAAWFFVSPDRAKRQAETYEASDPKHWAYAHERELASQYRTAIHKQSQHNRRKDAA